VIHSGPVRSLRLEPELDRQVRRAAAIKGESVSEFIRQAAATRAAETLAGRSRETFADVAGVVRGGGGRARRSGEAFADTLSRGGVRR
jgi:hypothetical protein